MAGATTRALVVYCHPDPESFCRAVLERTIVGLRASGHEVRLCDLYARGFQPELTATERATHDEPGTVAELDGYVEELRWADALVLVYPTWWSGQPAMLKGWIDRVWVRGVAWDFGARTGRLRGRLRHVRRVVVVTTHGSSKFVNILQGEAGKRVALRAIRAMCARRARTTWCAMYRMDASDDTARRSFLERVERTMEQL